MMVPRWRYVGFAALSLLVLHALLSIHPTYRATTSPSRFFPSSGSWRPGLAPPDSAIPQLSGKPRPTFDELKYDALEGRRKANAVFVVLGKHPKLYVCLSRQHEIRTYGLSWIR